MCGDVLPVGGVTEKIEAAVRAGAQKVLIPRDNWQDHYMEFAAEIVPVDTFEDVLHQTFGGTTISQTTVVSVS